MLSALTDMELLDAILSGNGAAFRTFYYRHADNIFGLVTRLMGPSRPDREDTVQEIFFQAYKSIGSFKRQASVLTWLFRIATNVTYSVMRKPSTRASKSTEEPSAVFNPEGRLDARRAIQQMYDILERLPAKQRMVFVLYEFQGFTLDQISDVLNIPLHTAASRLRRSREQIIPLLTSRTPRIPKEEP